MVIVEISSSPSQMWISSVLNRVIFNSYNPFVDSRGTFIRSFCDSWLPSAPVQGNVSITETKGTLRGFHYEKSLSSEWKLMRVIRGTIFLVCLDLAGLKEGQKKIVWKECSSQVNNRILIPSSFANCFVTLEDDVIISYAMGAKYELGDYGTICWRDPLFKDVPWPVTPRRISEKDSFATDFINEDFINWT